MYIILNTLQDLLHAIISLSDKFVSWLFSDGSSGILTLVTGLIAWWVYSHQLRLRKKEAAIVLINEILYIENAISEREKLNPYNELNNIAPTCSWDNNFQLFARSLWKESFQLLNSFFIKSRAAQHELEKLRAYYHESNLQKARSTQELLIDLSRKFANKSKEEYEKTRNDELVHSKKIGRASCRERV